ncbi:relaxase/mobilization nuclease domain-containing protein [Sphingobacterium sp. DK4209]|uniref:Relaxase/mobilization nuclease domain-containing protein n=1 Tax=Sphingobacterium zhuxiongii TaxID=2662364 RepID=A0A5Q0QG14_9SPHI|nr:MULTISPECIES: relaxase/mobilization nuclease domain-containing protein [unclassified Sphingobacterium]MVZ65742.1 relaxase/mobilization nuclease domain-containing protein [Sphingobacterium sp. DK4209]QGA27941.1 relaxase/mobilization nuclease domain-containing protein [Sphingobacterium sp. dk4302]
MFVRVHHVKSFHHALTYNERKVLEGNAQCLQACNFPLLRNNLTKELTKKYLNHWEAKNVTSQIKSLHFLLSFSPKNQHLDQGLLTEIARNYMRLTSLSQQPYLIYQHFDTAIPHLHIISTCIDQSGAKINTSMFVYRRSLPAVKELVRLYDLHTNKIVPASFLAKQPSPCKIEYGSVPSKQAIENIVDYLLKNYCVCDIYSWTALLSRWHIKPIILTREPRQTYGMLYYITDEKNKTVSSGIPASRLPSAPTWQKLSTYFKENENRKQKAETTIKNVLLYASCSTENSYASLARTLVKNGIVITHAKITKDEDPLAIVISFVDRVAVRLSELNLAISVENMLKMAELSASISHGKNKIFRDTNNITLSKNG